MTTACNLCGKTTDLMTCKKCKSVHYCNRECQVEDWPEHKAHCKRKEFAGAPCDACHETEEQIVYVCHECGFVFCRVCNEKMVHRNYKGEIISAGSCPACEMPRNRWSQLDEYKQKLESLIKERKGDPRAAYWLVQLGNFDNREEANEQKAKECYLRAGEGYARLAEIHAMNQNWDEARRFYRKAADRMNIHAIHVLGVEAQDGYFHYPDGSQSPKRPPDLKEAFRLFREGASLGHVGSYYRLGRCFLDGQGTKVNVAKAFKWIQKAAEKGHIAGMVYVGQFYLTGQGVVEQSYEQAKYWLEKSLESEEREEEANNLARELLRTHNL